MVIDTVCAMPIIDDLDRRLLMALRRDARIPVAVLAELLHVSRSTAQRRLDRLVESGVVRGFTVTVDEQYADLGVRAVCMVELSGVSTPRMSRRLADIEGIEAVHTTNGRWDIVCELRAGSLPDLDDVLAAVRSVSGVRNTETSILLTSY